MAVMVLIVEDAMPKDLEFIGDVRVILDDTVVSRGDVREERLAHFEDSCRCVSHD